MPMKKKNMHQEIELPSKDDLGTRQSLKTRIIKYIYSFDFKAELCANLLIYRPDIHLFYAAR